MKKRILLLISLCLFFIFSYPVFSFSIVANPSTIYIEDVSNAVKIEFVASGGTPDTTKHVMLKPSLLLGNPFPISLENIGGQWVGNKYVIYIPVTQDQLSSYEGSSLGFSAKDVNGNSASASISIKNKEDAPLDDTQNNEPDDEETQDDQSDESDDDSSDDSTGTTNSGNNGDGSSSNDQNQNEQGNVNTAKPEDPSTVMDPDEQLRILKREKKKDEIKRILSYDEIEYNSDTYSLYGEANSNLEIIQDASYSPDDNKTTVTVVLKPNKDFSNLEVYIEFPKCAASLVDDIEFNYLFGGKDFKVIKDDPVMFWNFGAVDDELKASYTLDGEITQDCLNQISLLPFGKVQKTQSPALLGIIAFLTVLVIFAIIFVYFKTYASPKERLTHEELKRRKLKGYIDTQLGKGQTLDDVIKKLKEIGYTNQEIDNARK